VHRQADDILDALARHQVVCYIAARGCGKTMLVADIEARLRDSGIAVISLSARTLLAPDDVLEPVAAHVGVSIARLRNGEYDQDVRIRILIDDAQDFHTHAWFQREQEEWRALLSRPAARGRLGMLLAGRPLFRTLAGGAGSPLLNLGITLTSRPLEPPDVQGCDQPSFLAHARKTGGHPHLTEELLRLTSGAADRLGEAAPRLLQEKRRYILRLIEDHAVTARGVLLDVLDARPAPVAAATLVPRRFGSSITFAHDCLADLVGSGLLLETDGNYGLGASLLAAGDVRSYLRAPEAVFPESVSDAYGVAAGQLFTLENRLRSIVAAELDAVDSVWWPSRVPDDLVAEAELRRKAEEDSAATADPDAHPLLFLTTGELFDLVASGANWGSIFHPALGITKLAFERARADITAVRNKVAHNRVVAQADVELLAAANARLGDRFRRASA
jgi:lambda repressor-like predicted transcriptional regulator